LKLLSRELAEHMGDIGCSIALRETPISHLRVGRAAVIELDHDTGVFLFRESDAEDGIVLATTDQHLLVDVIVGRFFKRSEGLSPQVRDGAVRALVGRSIDEVERDLILHTLRHCNGNRTHTAYMLDVSVRTLRNKLRGYLGGLTGSGDTG
jgi:transcriptional regulator of acetoin/glycerol metabolism